MTRMAAGPMHFGGAKHTRPLFPQAWQEDKDKRQEPVASELMMDG